MFILIDIPDDKALGALSLIMGITDQYNARFVAVTKVPNPAVPPFLRGSGAGFVATFEASGPRRLLVFEVPDQLSREFERRCAVVVGQETA